MSKKYTKEEVTEMFIGHVRLMVRYWENLPDKSQKEKLEGLAFSILSPIDGCAADLPAFILAPLPHEDDKEFHKSEGSSYFPENHNANVKCDIGGCLHEKFYK